MLQWSWAEPPLISSMLALLAVTRLDSGWVCLLHWSRGLSGRLCVEFLNDLCDWPVDLVCRLCLLHCCCGGTHLVERACYNGRGLSPLCSWVVDLVCRLCLHCLLRRYQILVGCACYIGRGRCRAACAWNF